MPLYAMPSLQTERRLATTSPLAYIITSKYADGLPLYRLEHMLKRLGHEVSRTSMAHWVIRLDGVFKPLINLMREVQNSSDYLQADGYSGYGKVCRNNGITRIGRWDHARRKFVEATKAAKPQGKGEPTNVSKAGVALSHINKLYAIERKIKELSVSERYRIRQDLSVPALKTLKAWLETNEGKVAKGTLTRTAMDYTMNQWPTLVGYCERGDLQISNVLAKNAIRPFALGRKAWLFADTSQGARASATCYSLVETAKANSIEPSIYIEHVLARIAEADTLENLEALLPWNVDLERASKKVSQID